MPPDWGAVLFGTPRARPGAAGPSPTVQAVQQKIIAEARRQGVKPALALGIAQAESSFNPNAVGDNGRSIGLFQLQPAAAQEVGLRPEERFDIDKNITGGIAYLKNRIAREGGDENRGIAAYNQGIGWRGGQYSNPQYVQTVRQYQQHFQQQPAVLAATRTVAAPAPVPRPSPRPAAPPQRDWSRELGETAMPPPARDWGQELFGTPTVTPATPAPSPAEGASPGAVPPVPQAPQAHPAIGKSAEWLGKMGVIPTVKMEQGRHPTLGEIARQRGQEAVQTGLGANLGELVGQLAGSAIAPGPGTVAGGTIGAMTGQAIEDLVRGRPFDPVAVGLEGALSLGPEALEGALRPVGRWFLRQTPGGRALRFHEAAQRARQWAQETFQPQSREEVGRAFEAVRQSGVRLDIEDLRHEVVRQTPGHYEDMLGEVRLLDHRHKTGGQYERLLEGLRTPPGGRRIVGWDIGDLQQFRSAIRDRLEAVDEPGARQMLGDLLQAVDRSVELGLARGRVQAGVVPETLQDARRQWGRLRAAEDLHSLVETNIRHTPNLEMLSFNLNSVYDEVRRGRNALSQSVLRGLEQTPGARQAYEQWAHHIGRMYNTIEVSMSDVSGFQRHWAVAGIGRMLSLIMTTAAGREAFREAVIEGRGRLSLNAVAQAANMARRELGLSPVEIPTGPDTPQEPPR